MVPAVALKRQEILQANSFISALDMTGQKYYAKHTLPYGCLYLGTFQLLYIFFKHLEFCEIEHANQLKVLHKIYCRPQMTRKLCGLDVTDLKQKGQHSSADQKHQPTDL